MKEIIQELYGYDRQLLGKGYDEALYRIGEMIDLKVIGIESGKQVGDWFVPNEWVMRDAWLKCNGEVILDYKKNPLCVTVYSLPINKKMKFEELKSHLHTSDEIPTAYQYDYRFYDRDWGFSIPKEKIASLPEDGEYEAYIDCSDQTGRMKIGIHTIPGKSSREILLFAHLDHPWQANDNLSGVACLIDLAKQIQGKFEHTIKIIFCPETIGSIAYAEKMDIKNVDFVLSVDSIGNDNTLLFQKSFDTYNRLNYCLHLAVAGQGVSYRKGEFRLVAGADEYYFNDPKIGIPGIFISRLPYKEYHTSADTPEKIIEDKIKEVQKVIMKTIEFYENDFIPVRGSLKGPLMRSRHGIQAGDKLMNRDLDYLYYSIDGEKYLSELVMGLGMGFEFGQSVLNKLIEENVISRLDTSKIEKPKTRGKKH